MKPGNRIREAEKQVSIVIEDHEDAVPKSNPPIRQIRETLDLLAEVMEDDDE